MYPFRTFSRSSRVAAVAALVATVPPELGRSASRIAMIGRQNFQWYLLSQQPIAPSAEARLALANRRAVSAMSSPRLAESARMTRFHSAGPWSCQNLGLIGGAGRARKRAELLDLVEVLRDMDIRLLGPVEASLDRGPAPLGHPQPPSTGSDPVPSKPQPSTTLAVRPV